MIFGNPSQFAVEWEWSKVYKRRSQRAVGFFVLHIEGNIFGVRSLDATLLACSMDAMQRRIIKRGTHCAQYESNATALEILNAFRSATYENETGGESCFGMTISAFRDITRGNEIVWIPDGDEAFDDGSHVLQFDQGDKVRIVGFKNLESLAKTAHTLTEVRMDADDFYGILGRAEQTFEQQWQAAVRVAEE